MRLRRLPLIISLNIFRDTYFFFCHKRIKFKLNGTFKGYPNPYTNLKHHILLKPHVDQSYRSTSAHQTTQQGNKKKLQRNMEICNISRKKCPNKLLHMVAKNTFYSSILATHKPARACTKYLGPNIQRYL